MKTCFKDNKFMKHFMDSSFYECFYECFSQISINIIYYQINLDDNKILLTN